jgi:DDE family transposase
MAWYPRIRTAIQQTVPFLLPTQATNLALVVSALLARRSFTLAALARAYPRPAPATRRVPTPKHDLLHRLKRLWRFLDNPRVDAQAIQRAVLPATIAQLGRPRQLGLAIDWTFFVAVAPDGRRIRYAVLRLAVPRRGRALPVLQLAYDLEALPAGHSLNQVEEAALLAVVGALPPGVRPVVLADRGFARAEFLAWLQQHGLDYVVRLDRGTCITEGAVGPGTAPGRRWKLGQEPADVAPAPGERRWCPAVRYGLHHGRPRALVIPLALCWQLPKSRQRLPRHVEPAEPWYLATSLSTGARAVAAWYQQRWWIEASFKDAHSRFGLKHTQIACPQRLSRLLAAFTLALCWLTLLALPHVRALPDDWRTAVAAWGRPSLLSLALEYLDTFHDLPATCLPSGP